MSTQKGVIFSHDDCSMPSSKSLSSTLVWNVVCL